MAINPTRRGGDGWEGGWGKEMTQHTWTPESYIGVAFSMSYENIGI